MSHTAIQQLDDAWAITVHESNLIYSHGKDTSKLNLHKAAKRTERLSQSMEIKLLTEFPLACLRSQMVGFVQAYMLYIWGQTLDCKWMKKFTVPEWSTQQEEKPVIVKYTCAS